VEESRLKRRRVVLAAGVFDLLHFGHLRALEDAKKAGGRGSRLIVIVARDKTVERLKGRRPILPEDQRRTLVEALKPVDKAILGYEEMNIAGVIQRIKPDVIAIGYDQHDMLKAVQEALKNYPGKVKVVKMRRYGPRNLNSSSKIKRRVIEELRP
jgi:FAD synthetase